MLRFCLLLASSSSLVTALQASAALRPASTRPLLLRPAFAANHVRMEVDEYPTLEEELASGAITQEEYDQMVGGLEEYTEEEYAAEQEAELSKGAQQIINNMKSESGVEFAPWMKIDAEAIARAKK